MTITTSFTIATVDFQDGPYLAENIGQVNAIPAGETDVSEIGYLVPPAAGTAIPMDTWLALTNTGPDYTVVTAADGATAAGASYTATATALTWLITDTGGTGGSASLAPAAVIATGGAPFTLTFTLDLPANLARETAMTITLQPIVCTDSPGAHIGGSFPVPSAPNLVATYAYRNITAGPTESLQEGGFVYSSGAPADITLPASVALILTAGGVEVTVNGASVYTSTDSNAGNAPVSALPLLNMYWSASPGASAFGVVLSDMRWSAP
jgi:hypothetical protein